MSTWNARTPEERGLLSPSFCAFLIWKAAVGYRNEGNKNFPFELAFLLIPIVLHRETRESLPRTASTSLGVWLSEYPLSKIVISERSKALVSHVREALLFGGVHHLFEFVETEIKVEVGQQRTINRVLTSSTEEVKVCAKRAEFIGKWFAKAGTSATVMALIGVKP